MDFALFVNYLARLEVTSSRNDITMILADLFTHAAKDPHTIRQTVYLLQARVAPQFDSIEFAFSDKMIIRALIKYSGQSSVEINNQYKKLGDIGDLAQSLIYTSKEKSSLSVVDVFQKLEQIALTGGTNSQTYKENQYLELIQQISGLEGKYLSRILNGSLRLGLSTKTMLDGLSWAITGDKSLRDKIEKIYGVRTDLGSVAEFVLTNDVNNLDDISVQPGIPVAPKLVEREKDNNAIWKRISPAIVQPKLDGLRVHIHYNRDGLSKNKNMEMSLFSGQEEQISKVKIFSRNLEDLSDMFPEIQKCIEKFNIQSLIIDGEAIGIDVDGSFLPFQETIKRKRKHNVEELVESHPVKIYAFDILEINGKDLLKMGTRERITILQKLLQDNPNDKILSVDSPTVESFEELESYFQQSLAKGYEGIIVKKIDSNYEPGTRNFDWIKMKGASVEGIADSIDAVVLGYYTGAGSRTKFGIGALLVGTYDEENEQFLSLAKVGTGFKDSDWTVFKEILDKNMITKLPDNIIIADVLMPDVIVDPHLVVVIEADMISQSKLHGNKDGYSLRFPRLKSIRSDKSPKDITTVKQIKQLFELQKK